MKKFLKLCVAFFLAASFTLAGAGCVDNGDGKEKEYNIIVTSATIPVVMAMLDTIDSGLETYMWFGRKQTFDNIDAFKELKNYHLVAQSSWSDASNIPMTAVDDMANTVMDLFVKSGKKAKFNLYVTDYGFEVAMRIFEDQKISEKNYNVRLMEDGIGSYQQFISKGQYAAADGMTRLQADIDEMNSSIEKVRDGSYVYSTEAVQNWKMCFPYSTRSNVEYWLQYPELLTSENDDVQKMLTDKSLHLVKKNLTEVYNDLNKEVQDKFKNIVFDVAELDKLVKQSNGKKAMIFTGTSYSGRNDAPGSEELGFAEGLNADEFEKVMDKVIELYGDEYNIVYKPHPSWDVYSDNSRWTSGDFVTQNGEALRQKRRKYLEDNQIKTIPGQIPMEVIIWAYADEIAMGGYNSSLYMNGSADTVAFFVLGSEEYNLSFPMNLLIQQGAFDDENGNKPLIICPQNIETLAKA